MSRCCEAANSGKSKPLIPEVREFPAWLLPSAVLMFVPKCPACFAAYVALWTGLGLSLTTATYLRLAMILLCVTSLLFLAVRRFSRRRISCSQFTCFNKELKKCNIK